MKKHHYIRGLDEDSHGEATIAYCATGSRPDGRWSVQVREQLHGMRFAFSKDCRSFAEAEEWLFSLGRRSKWQRV